MPVVVEVDLAPGLQGVQLVGLPDKAHHRTLVLPSANTSEASLIEELRIHTTPKMRELVLQLKGEQPRPGGGYRGAISVERATDGYRLQHCGRAEPSRQRHSTSGNS